MQLAVFDLDGTITRRDTFVPYVSGYLRDHLWRVPRLACVVPALVRFTFNRDRGDLKASLIHAALGNVIPAEIESWNARFVPALLATGTFRQARERIAMHRDAGDRLVLMSASPDLYVPVIASALGFDEAICTGVRWSGDRLSGELTTPNRRGEEKSRCLEALRARHPRLAVCAYGNSASDLHHLARVERGVLVNGPAKTRRIAALQGITCESWQ